MQNNVRLRGPQIGAEIRPYNWARLTIFPNGGPQIGAGIRHPKRGHLFVKFWTLICGLRPNYGQQKRTAEPQHCPQEEHEPDMLTDATAHSGIATQRGIEPRLV